MKQISHGNRFDIVEANDGIMYEMRYFFFLSSNEERFHELKVGSIYRISKRHAWIRYTENSTEHAEAQEAPNNATIPGVASDYEVGKGKGKGNGKIPQEVPEKFPVSVPLLCHRTTPGNPLFFDAKAPLPQPWKLFGVKVFLIPATRASVQHCYVIVKCEVRQKAH